MKISFFIFIYFYLTSKSIHHLIARLDKRYRNNGDYEISYLFGVLYIKQSKNGVADVLESDYELGYFNRIFNQSHGMMYTINNVDTNNPLWRTIHSGIKHSLENMVIHLPDIMKSNFPEVNKKTELKKELNNFFVKAWTKMMFGCDIGDDFEKVKNDMISLLNKNFYESKWYRTPIIGYYYSKYKFFKNRQEMDIIREKMKNICRMSIESQNPNVSKFFFEFVSKHANEIASDVHLDNMIMSLLIYDYMFNYILNATMKWIHSKDKSYNEFTKNVIEKSLLFPFRIRQHGRNIYLINLISSGYYFSHAKRICPAYSFIPKVIDAFYNCISDCNISVCSPFNNENTIIRNNNPDIPYVQSEWEVYWYKRDYFKNLLDSSKSYIDEKVAGEYGTRKYDICKLYSEMDVIRFVSNYMRTYADEFDVIVTPESRGYPLAGILAAVFDFKKPIYLIRKPGKVFAEKIAIDGMELCSNIDIKGKKVMIVDDGIASFESMETCIKLVNRLDGIVNLILAPILHHYCKPTQSYYENENKIITFFDM